MTSWIKAKHFFDDRSALLVVGERDVMEVGNLLRDNQDHPDILQEKLSAIINRCRPELVGHVLWFIEFSVERRAWQMYVNHASLPKTSMYAIPKSQRLRADDVGGEWFNGERNLWLSDMKSVEAPLDTDEPILVN